MFFLNIAEGGMVGQSLGVASKPFQLQQLIFEGPKKTFQKLQFFFCQPCPHGSFLILDDDYDMMSKSLKCYD